MADEDSFVVDEEDITFTADGPEVQQQRERKILDDDEAKEERLRGELAAVRELNTLIKSVNGTLEGALNKMETVTAAVGTANTLLDQYVRVLSQATHNSRLILNGRWQGTNADLAAIEAEQREAAEAAERRKREEHERAAAREREAAERENARKLAESKRGGKVGGMAGRKTPGSRSTSAQGGNYGGGYGSYGSASSSTTTGSRGIPRGRYNAPRGSTGSGIGRGYRGISRGTK